MKRIYSSIILVLALSLGSCGHAPDINVEPYETQLPTPSSVAQVITYIKSNDPAERIAGMWASLNYPNNGDDVLPLIVENLYYSNVEVKINAVKVLGELGVPANSAVPNLLAILESDDSIEILIEVTIALGSIGNKSAVPFLAKNLYTSNEQLAVYSAKSISQLTGVSFPDANSSGYHKDSNDNLYILLGAKGWWEKEGQYEDWSVP